MSVKTARGRPREGNTKFLHLDPARYSWGERVIGILRTWGSLPHLLPKSTWSVGEV